jgi:hypothetical protein
MQLAKLIKTVGPFEVLASIDSVSDAVEVRLICGEITIEFAYRWSCDGYTVDEDGVDWHDCLTVEDEHKVYDCGEDITISEPMLYLLCQRKNDLDLLVSDLIEIHRARYLKGHSPC